MHTPSQTTRASAWIIACILLVCGLSALNAVSLWRQNKTILDRDDPLFNAAWQIRYYDNVLTNAARLFAATGAARHRDEYDAHVPLLDAALELSAQIGNASDRALFENTAGTNNRLIEMETRAFALAAAGNTRRASAILSSAAYNRNKNVFQTAIQEFFRRHEARMESALSAQQRRLLLMLTMLALSSITGIGAVLLIVRRLRAKLFRPLSQIVDVATRISDGDLRDIANGNAIQESSQEFQDLFIATDQLSSSLREVIGRVQQSSEHMFSTANALHGDAGSLSQHVQNQASAAEEMSATLEEIGAGSEAISVMSTRQCAMLLGLAEASTHLSEQNEELQEFVNETNLRAAEIAMSVQSSRSDLADLDNSMQSLGRSTEEVNQIISIIHSIADRINLLSLNASIEAARAGEAGRGFAVVASEISRLADQTAGSVTSIEGIVSQNAVAMNAGIGTLRQMTSALETMGGGVHDINERIAAMRQVIARNMQTHTNIDTDAGESGQIAEQIERAIAEHKTALSEIITSVTTLSTRTQDIAGLAEGLHGKSRSLHANADELTERIAFFELRA